MMEKLRWRIAYLIVKLPGQCWADLVGWVLADRAERRDWYRRERLPWRPITSVCREDLARVGACYCGRLQRDGGVLGRRAQHDPSGDPWGDLP